MEEVEVAEVVDSEHEGGLDNTASSEKKKDQHVIDEAATETFIQVGMRKSHLK